jgi:hypothetical protein
MSYSTSVMICSSTERVWSMLIDVENWPRYTASMTSVERLDHGPFQCGSRARIKQPNVPPLVWTVTDFQPWQHFTWSATMVGVDLIATHALSQRASDSVALTLSIDYRGRLARPVEVLSSRLTRRYLKMECAGIKRVCEVA